jgi:single-strand DNA-binding protein
LAEIVGEYVQKGSRLYLEGRLQTSSWEDKQSGEKKYRTEIVAGDLVLLGGNREHESNGNDNHRFGKTQYSNGGQKRDSLEQQVPAAQDHDFPEPGAISDEDIPF